MMRRGLIALGIVLFLCLNISVALAQKADANDPKNLEKGKQLIQAVIEARGGARYLEFKTLLGTGQYTPFDRGASTVPKAFSDYIVYPDRERVEFGKGKKKDRNIQVNSGKTGWYYDGEAEVIKDMDEKQIQSFQDGLTYDLDRILRSGWKSAKKVWFWGREETRPGERADVVAIELEEGPLVMIVIDTYSKLPLKIVYEKTEDKGISKHEVRFFQYVAYDGVKFPNIVDFYRDGIQISRVNYDNVKLNVPVTEELFAKPASVKAIK